MSHHRYSFGNEPAFASIQENNGSRGSVDALDAVDSHFCFDNVKSILSRHRIMLVGGGGFIGHHLALQLANCGACVHVVDNLMINNMVSHLYASSPANNKNTAIQRQLYQNFLLHRVEAARDAGIVFHNVDARDSRALAGVFQVCNPTKVIHMSAVSSAVKAKADPGLTFDVQLNTLCNVLELVRLSSTPPEQVMLMSSSTIYGDFAGTSVDELSNLSPSGIYANTKYMSERLLRTYRDQYDVGCTIVRPSALYGEWCISRRVSQVFIEKALCGEPLMLEAQGNGWLDFTYIDDLIDGILRALAFYTYRSDTFNITYGSAKQVKELVNIITEYIPDVIIEERAASMDRPVRGTLTIDKARERLGYSPQWPLDKGYRRFCEYYIEQWQRAAHAVELSG